MEVCARAFSGRYSNPDSRARSLSRWIYTIAVFGSSSKNSIARGYLYGASRVLTKAFQNRPLKLERRAIECQRTPITAPHVGFHRRIGSFAGHYINPDVRVLSREEWERQANTWLSSSFESRFVNSLMCPVIEAGKYANWTASPARGINNQSADCEYVRFA